MRNIFDTIPADLQNELFESLVEGDRVRIERIISKGHTSPASGWYDQEQSEWVIVLRGAAVLEFDDAAPVTLNAGDFINIPPHRKHKVAWTAPDIETVWLAVHY